MPYLYIESFLNITGKSNMKKEKNLNTILKEKRNKLNMKENKSNIKENKIK